MAKLRLAAGAPDPKRPFCRIVLPTFQRPIKGIALCDKYLALWTHWCERSLVCYNTKACPHCQRQLPRRWKGFLPMCDLTRKVLFIAEITPPVARKLDGVIESQVHLCTLQIKLGRCKDRPNAPMTIELEELHDSQLKLPLPKPFNPLPTVLSTLGLGDEGIEIEE
jgi:hypothetical protein